MKSFKNTDIYRITNPFIELRFKIYDYVHEIFGEQKNDTMVKVNNRSVEVHFDDCILFVDDHPTIKIKSDNHFYFSDFDKYKELATKIYNYEKPTK